MLPSSLVFNIKNLLSSLQTTVCDLQLRLVEWLRLVKPVAVGCAVHVCVQILLGLPLSSIEELAVTCITTGHGVGAFGHQELGRLLKDGGAVSAAEVWLVVLLGA